MLVQEQQVGNCLETNDQMITKWLAGILDVHDKYNLHITMK